MGFYAPAQLVHDARAHGVTVLPVDVLRSDWDSTLEAPGGRRAARCAAPGAPGLQPHQRLQQEAAERLVAARAEAPSPAPKTWRAAPRSTRTSSRCWRRPMRCSPITGHRHQAAWAVAGVDTRATPLLRATRTHEAAAELARPTRGRTVLADYRATGLSLTQHPLALLRAQLAAFKVQPAAVLRHYPNGRLARASGLVTHRQRPETAKGVVFVTLEDDTGSVNVIVWPAVAEAQRRPLLAATLLTVYGVWQCEGEVRHLVAQARTGRPFVAAAGPGDAQPQLPLTLSRSTPRPCPSTKSAAACPCDPAPCRQAPPQPSLMQYSSTSVRSLPFRRMPMACSNTPAT